MERLKGNPRYWYFDLYGRTDPVVRQEAISLAESLPEKTQDDAAIEEVMELLRCCPGVP